MPKIISKSKLKHYWKVYLFVIPSVLLVAVFSYYPAISAMYHAFFRWNGEDINTYVGDENFRRLMGNYWIWLGVLASFAAVLFYSDKKDDSKSDLFRVIGGIFSVLIGGATLAFNGLAVTASSVSMADRGAAIGIALLIWGSLLAFFRLVLSEENDNRWIYFLICIDFLAAGIFESLGFTSLFAWMLTMVLTGFWLWLSPATEKLAHIDVVKTFQAFASLSICFWALAKHSGGDPMLWGGFTVVFILVLANIPKMIPSIATAVVIHRIKNDKMNYLYKVLFVVPMIIPGMVYLLLWKFFFDPNIGMFNKLLIYSKVMDVLVMIDNALGWGGIFNAAQTPPPIWLGNEHLVLPALILWGFPWVGMVGVLIYLAGLQGIDTSVYEAADLDGATAFQKFLHIEFPLILTQVRINLVLMIIGTIQSYQFVLILFGEDGGPNGRLMMPGLFMFKSAFSGGQAGYACAIGLILFAAILLLTELNNRYVRVDK